MRGLYCPNNKRSKVQNGMTLIELLVVCAIIGLLASIILPSLMTVRKQARRMACVGNLRAVGNALVLYRTAYGCFPHTDGPPRYAGLANIGKIALILVRESLGDPRALYCPISLEYDPHARPPCFETYDYNKHVFIEHWKTGQISYLYLPGVTDTFNDENGQPTFNPDRESPDKCKRAVLIGDRTVELAPGRKNIPGSNHGREGGWFYFTGGDAMWWPWDSLTAHPTHKYIWYWPRMTEKERP